MTAPAAFPCPAPPSPARWAPRPWAAGDWDGDGDLDLAVANFGADQVRILENDGTGGFSVPGPPITGQVGATALAAGDWDGDGDLDLAVANFGADQVRILEMTAPAVFRHLASLAAKSASVLSAAGDLNGDGKALTHLQLILDQTVSMF